MKTSSLLLPALLAMTLGTVACDKRAPPSAPVPPTMSDAPASATPSAVMPPASGGSAP